ncbi:MAG: class I SAM-dependent methyltransferase [Planctomycetes bacterium]|jgi:SAM-dependent methyltransferase|nr:class I SAM-dependent methyltransferase [Planctomycetota bacterium]
MAYARYFTEEGAEEYAGKYRKGWLRRLSARREASCVKRALAAAGAGGAILDLPCGAGRFTETLARTGQPYVAADLSMPMVRAGRAAAGTPVAALRADARRIGLKDRSVDGAVSIRLLHHFPDAGERRRILAELARVSRRFLVVTFLDRDSWKQRAHRRNPARPPRRAAIGREELREDAERLGFRVAGFFAVSSLFSGQTAAALVREGAGKSQSPNPKS